MLCSHSGKEILVKTLQSGDILGIETFFSDSVCTTSVSPFSRVKVNYLEKKVLQEWAEKFPALESKLYRYCLKFEKTHDVLKQKGLDRREQRRFRIEGKASLQILGVSGAPVGKPFRGNVFDISAIRPGLSGQAGQKRDRAVIAGSEHGTETQPRCQRR